MSNKHYDGSPCATCGGTLRYKKHDICVVCRSNYAKRPDVRNREKKKLRWRDPERKEYQRQYMKSPRHKVYMLWNGARVRAEKKKIPFTITQEFVLNRLSECGNQCEQTGTLFDCSQMKNLRINPDSPSLDQIIPGNGYTPDNTQLVAFWYNSAKGELTDNEIQHRMQHAKFKPI